MGHPISVGQSSVQGWRNLDYVVELYRNEAEMTPSRSQLSIQESLFPDLTCFGGGPANPDGFHLRSYYCDGGRTVATFTPRPEHDNGFGFLNGGIITTV